MKREDQAEVKDEDEGCNEERLLGDCVWFLLRYSSRMTRREPNTGMAEYSYHLHFALVLLNKYVIKKGLKASLVDQDRFLVAIACYFCSAKANSHFMRSKDLLEFYFYNRPI